jgi:glycosyltransferase involved in cell wall biosynthesis
MSGWTKTRRMVPAPAGIEPAPSAAPAAETRVLMLSHMDPRVSKGGAEIAAFQLYQELERRPGFRPFFLSCAPGKVEPRDGVTFAQPFGVDNYVYATRGFDHFIFSNPDGDLRGELTTLLHDIRPDIVHLHHYTNFGLEVLLAIREALPNARIVMALHEYLAICNHFGQMVKRPSFALCDRAGPRDCARCFPEHSPQDFFLRDLFIRRFFRLIDHFVSPSRFLADRYVAWGVPADRISVIENGVPALDRRGLVPYPPLDRGITFGFFGQISRLKGINVLLEAAAQLDGEADADIRIEVHGDYSSQPEEFQRDFKERLAKAPPNFRFMGPYDNARVDALMQSVHAVLVPSIWWENSPLVIQEAIANKRPVICSDIGGMAEKVRDGLDGFHFQAGSGWSLAALMRRLAADRQLLSNIQATIAVPPGVAETADAMIGVYTGTQ